MLAHKLHNSICYLSLLLALFVSRFVPGQDPQQDSVDRDYSSELPRFAPLSPEQAKESFQLLPGFDIELVASEPLIADPIAFAFDARSRLFVVEMRGYSEQGDENLGRIALLIDVDGDGQMDRRETFVEGLSWPTAIFPWRDGVLVATPPNLTWYRDTDDDGRSDHTEVWFNGFSRSNVQGMCNSLRWGMDGYLHGATSSAGASLRFVAKGSANSLNLRRTDFAVDPLTKSMRGVSGGGQHGLSFNRWGDKFVTSNSDHLQQIVDLEPLLKGASPRVKVPPVRRSIALDGPQAEVFRISPVEPWRIVRTRLRVGGLVPGPIEGGGRAAGYFTGATGTWIADAHAGYSINEEDTALICDVGSNLVHRKAMKDLGLYWEGKRADADSELLRSTDTWFRPVQLGDGPDGRIYIADMYREVIEHPKSLPQVIKKHLDLTSGRDRGRIWRLVPRNATKQETSVVNMAALSEEQLLQQLGHPVSWRRRTASRLLLERSIKDGAALQRVASSAESPEQQIFALHLARRLELLDPAILKLH